MLKGRDIEKIDNISPFIGALVDRARGETDSAPIKYIF